VRQAIVAGIVLVVDRFNIKIAGEGIETLGERDVLRELAFGICRVIYFCDHSWTYWAI